MHNNLTNNMRHCGGGLLFFLSSKKVHKVKNLFRGITHSEVIGVREAQTELSTPLKSMIWHQNRDLYPDLSPLSTISGLFGVILTRTEKKNNRFVKNDQSLYFDRFLPEMLDEIIVNLIVLYSKYLIFLRKNHTV